MVIITVVVGAVTFGIGALGAWLFTKPAADYSQRKTETAVNNIIEIQPKGNQPDIFMLIIVVSLILLGLMRIFEFTYFVYKRHYIKLKKRFTNNNNVNSNNNNNIVEQV